VDEQTREVGPHATLRAGEPAATASESGARRTKEDAGPSLPTATGSQAPEHDTALVLEGRYRLQTELGRGGMGRVFRAQDLKLRRDVAVKMLVPGVHDEHHLQRFEQEARAAGSLNHPNILDVHDIGLHEDEPFIVEELLEGDSLRDILRRGPLQSEKVVGLALQMARGLAAAHAKGIVHRDLKPENIFLTTEGTIKLLDFGIAKLLGPDEQKPLTSDAPEPPAHMTRTGVVVGTVGYMSPEQVRGEHTDQRSDVFSFGAVLYEMLSGRQAFAGSSFAECRQAILHDEPPLLPAADPQPLAKLIRRCLKKEPAERPASAQELVQHLNELSERSGTRSHRWRAWAAGALVAAVAAGGAVELWHSRSGAAPQPIARRSVAVLGFRNLSGNPEAEWVSTALSEMFATELSVDEALRTIPGESVVQMKRALQLPDADSLGPETLAKIRRNLGSDLVVLGSFVDLGNEGDGQLRVDIRLQDASAGTTIAALSDSGTKAHLIDLVARAGARLREKAGIAAPSSASTAQLTASLSPNQDALRFYYEGLAKARAFDSRAAREDLERSISLDPAFPLSHAALSAALFSLGYDQRAKDEAEKALALSARLPNSERLLVKGQYHRAWRQWPQAIDTYRGLFTSFPDNVDHGLRLASVQSSAGKGKDALVTVAELRKLPPPASQDARIDLAEAMAAAQIGDLKRQLAFARAGAEKAAAQGVPLVAGQLLIWEGDALLDLGEPKKAIEAHQRAKELFALAGDRGRVAQAHERIGTVLVEMRDYPGARKALGDALAITRELGTQASTGNILGELAIMFRHERKFPEAEKLLREALAIQRQAGNLRGQANALGNLANVYQSAGDLDAALETFEAVLAIQQQMGNALDVGITHANIANVLYKQGHISDAQSKIASAIVRSRERGDKFGTAWDLVTQYGVLLAAGDLPGARRSAEEALSISKDIDEKASVAASTAILAEVLLEDDQPSQARARIDAAVAIWKAVGDPNGLTVGKLLLANVSMAEDKLDAAEAYAREAVEEFHEQDDFDSELNACARLIEILVLRHKLDDATLFAKRAGLLASKSQNVILKLPVEASVAWLAALTGKRQEGMDRLQAVLVESTRIGFVPVQLNVRLALAYVRRSNRSPVAAGSAIELERDARRLKFRWLARRAAALQSLQ
jgi:eukaryotic-like serine/threonine-protein kinase